MQIDYTKMYNDILDEFDDINFIRLMEHYKLPSEQSRIIFSCAESIVTKTKNRIIANFLKQCESISDAEKRIRAKNKLEKINVEIEQHKNLFEDPEDKNYELFLFTNGVLCGSAGDTLIDSIGNSFNLFKREPRALDIVCIGFAYGQSKLIIETLSEVKLNTNKKRSYPNSFKKALGRFIYLVAYYNILDRRYQFEEGKETYKEYTKKWLERLKIPIDEANSLRQYNYAFSIKENSFDSEKKIIVEHIIPILLTDYPELAEEIKKLPSTPQTIKKKV